MSDLYEFRVKGRLDQRWAAYFDGLTLTTLAEGETVLRGEVVDQAALHRLLSRIRDLGLTLVLVKRLKADH